MDRIVLAPMIAIHFQTVASNAIERQRTTGDVRRLQMLSKINQPYHCLPTLHTSAH
jgi:hypothetical protein